MVLFQLLQVLMSKTLKKRKNWHNLMMIIGMGSLGSLGAYIAT